MQPKNIKKPSVSLLGGFVLLLIYLGIFYTIWAISQVNYPDIGKNEQNIMLWYAVPTILASIFVVMLITALGWWKKILFDKHVIGPKWTYILPLSMFAVIIINFLGVKSSGLTAGLLLWGVLGGIGVGIGEEITTRGSLLVGLRSRYNEGTVWLLSTLAFSAIHIPNALFGLAFSQMLLQLLFTFIMGSAFYTMRRVSGSVIMPIVLHGLWDTSIFLPQATGGQGFVVGALVIYLLAIICTIPVIKASWNSRLHS